MGTRSLTNVIDNGDIILTLYRQFDGYPSGHGSDIKDALSGKSLVNGYNDANEQINGMPSAAVMLVASVADRNPDGKPVTGNFYIYEPGSTDCGEEFVYDLFEKDGLIHLKCSSDNTLIYDGPLDDFPVTD